MTTQEIAEKLVNLCREGKNDEVITELYADNILSMEPEGSGFERTEGIDAVIKKNSVWNESVEEFHSASISDPIVAGNYFACTMSFDITFKKTGRKSMTELAVYEIENGKIVTEEFFYTII